ncbi:transcription factor Adf-1-like [Gouania willdenowi]|uniref:transcription factor Adf-1-like n=1 Tax=Gouania willdenowi TaxID=441366 RepID=UPI001054EF65|nr:transcription factor Adf-1-like [Gouania willdenowi]
MLILEIENHRILYDPSHPFYKDAHKKEVAWNTIAEVIGEDVDLCKVKWRALRDSFVRSKKRSNKEWKYSDILSFLLPYIQPRSSKSTLSSVFAEEERSSTPVSACGSDEPAPPALSRSMSPTATDTVSTAEPVSRPTTSSEPRRPRSPRRRGSRTDSRRSQTPQHTSDVEDRNLSVLEEPIPKQDSDLDECYHFVMSLIPQLKRMDRNRRQQAKIGILNLLHNIESTEPQQTGSNEPRPSTSA